MALFTLILLSFAGLIILFGLAVGVAYLVDIWERKIVNKL